jgi:hypothetical protein
MSLSPGLIDVTRRVVSILDRMQLRYAVGGALAMALMRYIRATTDLDVLVLLPAIRSQEFADALGADGFVMRDDQDRPRPIEVAEMRRSTQELGHFRVWLGTTRVEFFSPLVPLQDAILDRRRRAMLGGLPLWIATVEDLLLLKMVFHRPKDLDDVRHLLAANAAELDAAYLERWIPQTLEHAVGEELRAMMQKAGLHTP